jgi:hypothetical protein
MVNRDKTLEDKVFGISPLGGNSVEGTGDGMAEVRSTETQGVPLVWDPRVNAFISEQAVMELDDRDISEQRRLIHQEEEDFRQKAGFGTNQ